MSLAVFLTLIQLALLPPGILGQIQGNAAARLSLCSGLPDPASYTDTSFLGPIKSVKVGTADISFHQFGPISSSSASARPLVLLAGSEATSSVWTPDLLRGLAQGRQVTTFDYPGMGLSSDTAGNYSVEYIAESVALLLQALSLDQPDALGWSLGGAVVLQMVVDDPRVFSRIVLASTSAAGPGLFSSPEADAAAQELGMLPFDMATPPEFIYPDTPEGNTGMCRFVASLRLMPQDEPQAAQIAAQKEQEAPFWTATHADVYDQLGDISIPVLVVFGAKDVILPPANSLELVRLIPAASMFQFADAGHAAILQHDSASAALVSIFLDVDVAANVTSTSL